MFRITEDPSSGSLVQCLANNYSNGSIVSVDMNKVGVMAAYCDRCVCVCVCVVHCASVAYPGILFGGVGGVQQIQLRTEDRQNGGLGGR